MNVPLQFPPAPREPIMKTVGSVTFEDPYASLHSDTPESLAWQWQQDALAEREARSWPGFEKLKAAIASFNGAGWLMASAKRRLGGRWFWTASSSAANPTRTVWSASSLEETGQPIVEMAALVKPEDVATTLVYSFEPSPNGKFVVVSVCSHGAMVGEWRVIEVVTHRVLPIAISATVYTGAVPGWLPDSSGFYYNDRAESGRHRLRFMPVEQGTAARADAVFEFADVPANVSGLTPEVSPDGRWLIGLAGPHERIAYVIGDLASGRWRRFLPEGHEGECSGAWLDANSYVARVHTDEHPCGRIVAIPAATSTDVSSWRELAPQNRAVLRAVGVVGERIVVADVLDVSTRFRTLASDGSDERVVPLEGPGNSLIAMIMRRFDSSTALSFDYQTFTSSTAIYHFDLASHRLTTLVAPQIRLDGINVSQSFARSLDGTRVPYFVVHRKDVPLDSPRPALITAYGGFNVSLMPTFLAHLAPFVQAGGVLIHANLRGGGEYGKHWHEAGRLACKWNVFLDLFAVAEQVIADGVTRPDRLAMMGGSNGGLLAGVAIVHRPDLWRVVVPMVPLFDQMEPLPSDPQYAPVRAIFLEDYGDPAHPAMSKVLYSYSPYHNVRDGAAYPAVFQVFGEKDLGCMPFHGRKFTARLQAATTSGRHVLLRVWRNTGHGSVDKTTALLQATEWVGFIMRELGMQLE
jgi:prolyl oligopeptidase